jgi:hypothetical protein
VVAAALSLSRRSPDPRGAAIGELVGGRGPAARPPAAGDIQYRVVEEIVDLVESIEATAGRDAQMDYSGLSNGGSSLGRPQGSAGAGGSAAAGRGWRAHSRCRQPRQQSLREIRLVSR